MIQREKRSGQHPRPNAKFPIAINLPKGNVERRLRKKCWLGKLVFENAWKKEGNCWWKTEQGNVVEQAER